MKKTSNDLLRELILIDKINGITSQFSLSDIYDIGDFMGIPKIFEINKLLIELVRKEFVKHDTFTLTYEVTELGADQWKN